MQIVHYPHPTLFYESRPVARVDAELKRIIAEMFRLMYEHKGIGLAANQVDLPLRLFVMNLEGDPEKGEERVFINPVVSRPRGRAVAEEGCLSIPKVYGPVRRPEKIRLTAYTLDGKEFAEDLDGMFARVVQHETDHLDGILFPTRMAEEDRDEIEDELLGLEAEFKAQREVGDVGTDDEIAAGRSAWERQYCG